MIGITNRSISKEEAHSICIEAVQYLAGHAEDLERFITLTGMMPDQLRDIVNDDGVKSGVLDFFLSDDSLLCAFAETIGRHPEHVASARMVITGEPLSM
ncbi:DUF3572 domain-containing protein [Coralliovum pocilloporae]|uniref:DUF3572 domain-containing protein n=1 Tax=Coralliovum pocilloporae TaxID=3066369 RepID=UPI003307915F